MLTPDDFDILIEALDLWADEPYNARSKETVAALMITKVSGKSEAYMINLLETAYDQMTREVKARKEQATLLKARLIQARDKQDIRNFLGDLADDD